MKNEQYTSNNPMLIPINESRGIPNILKNIINDVFYKVINKIKNPNEIIILDFEYEKFNIKNLHINIIDRKISDIYATSKFGIFNGKELKNSIIDIYLDFNKYDNIDLKRIILHELLHIYEIFNRIKNKSKKDLQWNINKILLDIRSKYTDTFLSDFIYMIYLSLDQEINSRVAETYIILMEINSDNRKELINELKNTSAWKYKNYLNDFNVNDYKIDEYLFLEFLNELSEKILSKYDVNFKIFKRNDINDWLKLFKKKSKYFENKLLKLVDEVINDVKLIKTSYVDIDKTKKLSEQFITKYDTFLENKSIEYKNKRKTI